MIGFSFVYASDRHEVREDIHGLALKASGEWGHVLDGGLPRYEGAVEGSQVFLYGDAVTDIQLIGPPNGAVSIRANGDEVASIRELTLSTHQGSPALVRPDDTLLAFVPDGKTWWLRGRDRDHELGPVLFLFEGRPVEEPTARVGPRSRLSALAARLVSA